MIYKNNLTIILLFSFPDDSVVVLKPVSVAFTEFETNRVSFCSRKSKSAIWVCASELSMCLVLKAAPSEGRISQLHASLRLSYFREESTHYKIDCYSSWGIITVISVFGNKCDLLRV